MLLLHLTFDRRRRARAQTLPWQRRPSPLLEYPPALADVTARFNICSHCSSPAGLRRPRRDGTGRASRAIGRSMMEIIGSLPFFCREPASQPPDRTAAATARRTAHTTTTCPCFMFMSQFVGFLWCKARACPRSRFQRKKWVTFGRPAGSWGDCGSTHKDNCSYFFYVILVRENISCSWG